MGEDFDEALLQGLADAGGGHLSFIERPEQITDLIASEVGELLEIVARDAAIELTMLDGLTVRYGVSVPARNSRQPDRHAPDHRGSIRRIVGTRSMERSNDAIAPMPDRSADATRYASA